MPDDFASLLAWLHERVGDESRLPASASADFGEVSVQFSAKR